MKLVEKVTKTRFDDGHIHERNFQPCFEGDLAMRYVERWGMIMAEDGGEDSMGRAKVRSAKPEEIVNRAFATAKLVVKKLQDEKLLLKVDAFTEKQAA